MALPHPPKWDSPSEISVGVASNLRLHRSRRALVVIALVAAAVTTTFFWLADSGLLALPSAAIPQGTGSSGQLATFTALTPSTVTIPQGQGAQIINGVVLGKAAIAAGFANKLRVDIGWIDPQNAGRVFNNPNGWLTFGIYYPIHTGACVQNTDPTGALSVTDGSQLCAALNTQGTGPLVNNGQLTINPTMLTGFIMVAATDPSPTSLCAGTGSGWCAPSGLGLSANQNLFYIIASVDTPGGIPPGQQAGLTTLNFYLSAHAL
jgi:hypothetical protein